MKRKTLLLFSNIGLYTNYNLSDKLLVEFEMFFLCPVGQSTLHDDFRPHQRSATFDQFTHSSHAQKIVFWQENQKHLIFARTRTVSTPCKLNCIHHYDIRGHFISSNITDFQTYVRGYINLLLVQRVTGLFR